MKNHRRLLAGALATGLVFALTLGVVEPAAAASPVTPLSVLPSQIVRGTAPTSGGPLADASAVRMAQLYKFLTSPATVSALKSQAAGTATKTETDLIAAAAKNVKIPTGVGTLVKGAGAAGVAYTGWQVGTFMGAGAAGGITQTLWGVDANSLVCSAATGTGQGFLSFFSGQKCADFNAANGLQVNTDAKTGLTMPASCATTGTYKGWCVNLTGRGTFLGDDTFCLQMTAPGGLENGRIYDVAYSFQYGPKASDATTSSARLQAGSERWICEGKSGALTAAERFTPGGTETLRAVGMGALGEAPLSPVQNGTGNPSRWLECTTTGSKGSTVTGRGGSYTETDADWNGAVPKDCGTLPAGELPTGTKIDLVTDGADKRTLLDQPTPAKTVEELGGQFSSCLQTVCQLILEKNGISCFDGADCTGWFADSSTGTSTNAYTCKYAGQAVALTECTVYKPSWEPDALLSGQVLADPVTGQAKPNSTNPGEQAATPTPGTDTLDPTVSDDRIRCFPNGFTLNPLDWVLAPLKCAFSPRESVVKATQAKVAAAAAATPAGQMQTAVAGWDLDVPDGCSGFIIDVAFLGPPFSLASACPGTMLAPIAEWARIFCGLATVVAGFVSIRNSVAGVASFRGGE